MARAKSVLGAHADRVKTDMRLPKTLSKRVHELAEYLGVPANVVHTIAIAHLIGMLIRTQVDIENREEVLAEMERIIMATFRFIREKEGAKK